VVVEILSFIELFQYSYKGVIQFLLICLCYLYDIIDSFNTL